MFRFGAILSGWLAYTSLFVAFPAGYNLIAAILLTASLYLLQRQFTTKSKEITSDQ